MPRNLTIALVLLLLPTALSAQIDVPTSPHAVFQMAERQDWVLRVTTGNGATVEGRVREVSADGVRLEGGRVRHGDVTRIERGERAGGGGVRGALIGGVVGGVAFSLLMFALPGEEIGDLALVGIPAIGAGLGALIGGLIGAAIDPAETEWRAVWPAATP